MQNVSTLCLDLKTFAQVVPGFRAHMEFRARPGLYIRMAAVSTNKKVASGELALRVCRRLARLNILPPVDDGN